MTLRHGRPTHGRDGHTGRASISTAVAAMVLVSSATIVMSARAPAAGAATITVTTSSDAVSTTDGFCSLREAVTAANSDTASGPTPGECPRGDPGGDTIVLASGDPYTLTPAGGSLHITSALTISGAGAASTTIDAGGRDRVLDVGAAPAVSLLGLTIRGGHAPDGTTLVGGSHLAGNGGGIRNVGVLTLTDVRVIGNQAGNGLAGSNDPAIGHAGSIGGAGGGIYNGGTLSLIRTTVTGNDAGSGGTGFFVTSIAPGVGGRGGAGGGVANAAGANLSILDSSLAGNRAGAGGAGGDGGMGSTSNAAAGGDGGAGGGLWNAGTLSVVRSAIAANAAGRGGTGGAAPGGMVRTGGPGGNGGYGGGVFDISTTSQTVANSTIAGNGAGAGGNGGTGGDLASGGYGGSGGGGGGVTTASAILTLLDLTVSANQVGAGGDPGPGAAAGGIGGGGGINAFGAATVRNTIVAGNSGGNCLGAIADPAHNLSFPDATCGTVGFIVADPKLGVLQDNGGPTATAALAPGSAAIDRVPATGAGCPAGDQRAVLRPQGPACDIGAFELGLAPPAIVVPPTIPSAPADGGGGGRGGGDGGGSVRAPVVSRLKIAPRAFAAASSAPSAGAAAARRTRRATPGAKVSYTLDMAASVRFTVRHALSGRADGKGRSARCVALTKRNRTARRCTRTVTLRGSFTVSGTRGGNGFRFRGRIGAHTLAPGAYTLVATPSASRTLGRAATIAFRIVR
ncbi:MAG: hypothetical protein JWQ48_2994 [Conexibacter sp.]|nr:hypothetical protein [Conexibacter sp.]